ncbi:ATP-binding cassette domain-containing protein [Oceanobacillus luteolus]|uniref:ATP-binding cassette domain-containing protein n=1 Tax=Oceanobacillus luteolus TaxID=1274358 RepID=UPI002040F9D5|nr:ATP-binding cassette domain-containing protein [Oceanobacillus luteolus]MCM3739335.1 ATP-binding cassette domain-containing protein [Oceanobacillus luteolus]
MENRNGINIQINKLEKVYDNRNVLNGLDVEIKKGEFVSVVGKSGCGKSTLLRLVAGLEDAEGGSIILDGEKLEGLNKKARIMFQDGRLLPWKRIIDNVCIGLSTEKRNKALEALAQVGLEERKDDYPSKLSGGQKQRVALARALVHNPDLLLLDEPLGALDALTRLEMQELIESLWRQKKFTAVLVTHDAEEAVAISDRVLLIDQGKISLDQTISLPRPRKRTNPAFALYVDDILSQIMNRNEDKEYPVLLPELSLSLLDSVNN